MSSWTSLLLSCLSVLCSAKTSDDKIIEQAVSSLESNYSYSVREGKYSFFSLDDCAKYDLATCFALNPSSPYGMVHLPPGPNETDYTACDVTDSSKCGYCFYGDDWGTCINGSSHFWRMDAGEAWVAFGRTPPKCKYWSMTNYLYYHYYDTDFVPTYESPTLFGQLQKCDTPGMCPVFASIGEALNMDTVAAQTGGTGFNEQVAIIASTDVNTEASIRETLVASGFPASHIFSNNYPGQLLNLDVTSNQGDSLSSLLRVTLVDDEAEGEKYFADGNSFRVFRVTPGPKAEKKPTPPNVWINRKTGVMESCSGYDFDEVGDYLDELQEAILEKYDDIVNRFEFTLQQPFFDTGIDCISGALQCNGDCHDTLYPISGNIVVSEFCLAIDARVIWYSIGAAIALLLFGTQCFVAKRAERGQCMSWICCNGCRDRQFSSVPQNAKATEDQQEDQQEDQKEDQQEDQQQEDPQKINKQVADGAENGFLIFCKGCFCSHQDDKRNIFCFGFLKQWWQAFLLCLIAFVVGVIVGEIQWAVECGEGNAATLDNFETDFFVMYGVNHAFCGKALYSSLVTYDYEKLAGIASTPNSMNGLSGTAEYFLGPDHPANEFLYTHTYTRDCSGIKSACTEVPSTGSAPIPNGHHIMWIARMYNNPETGIGASEDEIHLGRGVHFFEK